MTWTPTSCFLKGVVIKPFKPKNKRLSLPESENLPLKNLYPGDQVYVFETNNLKWGRGYVIHPSIGNDLKVISIRLNEVDQSSVVFPMNRIKIIDNIDFCKITNEVSSETENDKPNTPKFPRDNNQQYLSIKNQIGCAVNELNGLVFASYACGEINVFNQLKNVYLKLYDYYLRYIHNLFNEIETIETITKLLNEVTKILARVPYKPSLSSSSMIWLEVASKYCYMLARDKSNGEILNLGNSIPPTIAKAQEELILTNNNSVNIPTQSQLTLAPHNFKEYKNSHLLVNITDVQGDSSTQSTGLHNLFLHVYLRNETKRLTEPFVFKTKSIDDLQKVETISSILFRNLPEDQFDQNVFMVFVLTEEISLMRRKTFANLKYIKKGVAAGVINISKVFTQNQPNFHFDIKLFGAPLGGGGKKSSKSTFSWGVLVDKLIRGNIEGLVASSPIVQQVSASVKLIKHSPFGLSTKTKFSKHHSNLPITMIKPMFFDPFTETTERLYILLGQLALKKKKNSTDLYSVEISAPNNETIKFSQATNQREKKIWQLVGVTSSECFGEFIKIDNISLKNKNKKLPIDDYLQLTVYINGVLSGQGHLHYKSGNKLVEYRSKPHAVEIFSTSKGNQIASIEVSSTYVGKLFNSEVTIDNILEYESLYHSGTPGIDGLSSSLELFQKVKKKHLIRRFPELLTSLFGIIIISGADTDSTNLQNLQENTFKAIVFLLNSVLFKPQQHGHFLQCFEDIFINQPRIAVFLWTKLREVYYRGETIWDSYSKSVAKVQEILIRFATKSIQGSWEFEEYNETVVQSYRAMAHFLSMKSSLLIEDQINLLGIVDLMLTNTMYFDKRVVLNWYETFIDAIRLRSFGGHEKLMEDQEHKIQISKLLLILRVLGTELNRDKDTRSTVLLKSIEWAVEGFPDVTDIESVRLACSILNKCCTVIYELLVEGETDIIEVCHFLFKLLPALSRTFLKYSHIGNLAQQKSFGTQLFPQIYPFETVAIDQSFTDVGFCEVLVELAVVIGFIARIDKEIAVDNDDRTLHLADLYSRDDMYTVIIAVNEICKYEYFPSHNWLSLQAIIAESSLCVLELLSPVIFQKYIMGISLDINLCGEFLSTLLKLAILDTVALEGLPVLARAASTSITCSIGARVELLIDKVWGRLGDYVNKHKLESSLATLVLDYDLIHNVVLYTLKCTQTRKTGSKLLISIMKNYNQIEVERQCIISLFDIYCNGLYEPCESDELGFINNLNEFSTTNESETDQINMLFDFVAYLSRFIRVLNRLIRVPDTVEFNDDKVVYKIQALLYLVNVGEPEPLREFVGDLYKETIAQKDHIQAGLYLELLASTFPWSHGEYVTASLIPELPIQTNFERREALLELSAEHYISGHNLSKAIDVYNFMLNAFKNETYDLLRLSRLHGKLSLRYMELEYQDTIQHSYCRVVFLGNGFPEVLRGKQRIYEGQPFEHFTSIQQRILSKFPGSALYKDDGTDGKNLTGKYLDITLVYPNKSESRHDKKSFSVLKKVPGSSSIFDLWTEETTFETKSSFPTLMNFNDIASYKVIKLSPLDNASRTINAKTSELLRLERSIHRSMTDQTKSRGLFLDLSRELAGTVDSPINGGVGQYRLFLEYIGESNNNQAGKIKTLQNAFDELTTILKRCLDLHGRIVPESMRLSHQALVELFEKNFNDRIEAAYSSRDESDSSSSSSDPSTRPVSGGILRSHSMTPSVATMPEPRLAKTVTSTTGSSDTSYTSGKSSFLSNSLSLKRRFRWRKNANN